MDSEDQTTQDSYTQVLVQLGVLQAGQKTTLDGIEEIKRTMNGHSARIGTVESKVAVLESKLSGAEDDIKNATPAKDRTVTVIAVIVATCAVALPLVQWLISL